MAASPEQNSPKNWTMMKMFQDPTLGGVINQRLLHTFLKMSTEMDLSDPERDHFVRLVVLIGKKMCSVWNHLDRFRAEQAQAIERMKAQHEANPNRVNADLSSDLFIEFDEFVVQIKSTLDHMVKIPVPIFGQKRWTLATFGNKGQDVIKALKNNVPNEYKAKSADIEDFLFNKGNHKQWLELTIDARDRINHHLHGGMKLEAFGVAVDKEGTVHVPRWGPDQTLLDLMEAIWGAFVLFVEAFIGSFARLRLKEMWVIKYEAKPPTETKSSWELLPSIMFDPKFQESIAQLKAKAAEQKPKT